MRDHVQAKSLCEKVLNYMLAPADVLTHDQRFIEIGQDSIEMRIRWHSQLAFTTPGMFLQDIERILRPISEAITYGEVVDLRERVKILEARRRR